MRRRALLLAAPLLAAAGDDFGPPPSDLPGARSIGTEEAAAIFARQEAVWIDVLPAPRRPEGLPPGALWRPSPRMGIPGSLWLPEAGRGVLPQDVEAQFRAALERVTQGDRDRPLVFYCLLDCRMSWNAAKRAADWGWRQVLWYRDGTDGWEMAGLPTESLQPAPGWQ